MNALLGLVAATALILKMGFAAAAPGADLVKTTVSYRKVEGHVLLADVNRLRLAKRHLTNGLGTATAQLSSAQLVHDQVAVRGLYAHTELFLDQWGVPHIYASTVHDAFLAQGWNAARDRLWQMDLWRRSGLGELAAALGSNYVAQDRAIRLFVYRGDMRREWATYGPGVKRETEAFVEGVNAYIAATRSNPSLLPLEFRFAGYRPSFWKAEDVVRVRDHGLVGSAFGEVARAQGACKTGSLASTELLMKISPPWDPVIPEGLDLCSIPADVLENYALALQPVRLSDGYPHAENVMTHPQEYVSDPDISPSTQGSNNWAIAPQKSATGRPILASDPHRFLELPSVRYIAHLSAPGLNVIGAGEPSVPGISIGHNDHVAFGITVFPIAQEDLYVYETNPNNSNEYRYHDGWEPMRVVHESIAVRDRPDVSVELKFTRHGPVLREDPARHRAYALRAAWLDTGGAAYFGSMAYLRAKNQREFVEALNHWGAPGENQVYADTEGRIGWFPVGFAPIRANSDGLLPLPGDGRYEWTGYLDRELLPSEINPARGYIATANQMDLPPGYPYSTRRIGFSWADDTRFDRINQVLEELPKVSLKDSESLQNDSLNSQAVRLISVLKTLSSSDQQLLDTIQWLGSWDGHVTSASPQAALYEVWCAHYLVTKVLESVAPALPEDARVFRGLWVPETIVELLERPDQRLGPAPVDERNKLMLETLANAVKETKERLGPDRSQWQWGNLSLMLFEHPLAAFAGGTLKRKLDVGPAPKGGDGSVVGLAAYRTQDFRTLVGASFRMVIDVGHWDNSVAVNAPGQSGDPDSPHYRDLFQLWLDGEYFPLLYSRAAVEQASRRKIVLIPR